MSQANPTRDDAIEKDVAIVDVGLKVEGRIALKEFGAKGKDGTLKVGDEVEVYVERIENALGEAVLSREKARREESWVRLEEKFEAGERVEGVIFNQVKGGFTVDLDGAVAFLPRSQVDIRPIRDVTPLMHNPQPFEILKMDRAAATSLCRAVRFSKRSAPNSVRKSSRTSKKARLSTASSRTSPITVRSLTSAASTACCMSPTWHGAASTIRPKS
jgi:ribosomal protein S1